MMRTIELSNTERKNILNDFYAYFRTGYQFEDFLKVYLEKLGLDEVSVTQRSRDGGIDLTATRPGLAGLGIIDSQRYYIQAKRYAPNTLISIAAVRALYGVCKKDGRIGIFITTGRFSTKTHEEWDKELLLIDGEALVNSCIDNHIGFQYKPVFNVENMKEFMSKNRDVSSELYKSINNLSQESIVVEKKISANDIRARILSMPRVILEKIPEAQEEISVKFNDEISQILTICRGRNYLAGITDIYKKYGLLNNKTPIPANAVWQLSSEGLEIHIRSGDK